MSPGNDHKSCSKNVLLHNNIKGQGEPSLQKCNVIWPSNFYIYKNVYYMRKKKSAFHKVTLKKLERKIGIYFLKNKFFRILMCKMNSFFF
jgi:hypothetical protein